MKNGLLIILIFMVVGCSKVLVNDEFIVDQYEQSLASIGTELTNGWYSIDSRFLRGIDISQEKATVVKKVDFSEESQEHVVLTIVGEESPVLELVNDPTFRINEELDYEDPAVKRYIENKKALLRKYENGEITLDDLASTPGEVRLFHEKLNYSSNPRYMYVPTSNHGGAYAGTAGSSFSYYRDWVFAHLNVYATIHDETPSGNASVSIYVDDTWAGRNWILAASHSNIHYRNMPYIESGIRLFWWNYHVKFTFNSAGTLLYSFNWG